MLRDTIIAVSSAAASGNVPGVRGIVRVSGDGAWGMVRAISDLPETAARGWHGGIGFTLGGISVSGGVLLLEGPRSFTGEDIAEMHVPNSPVLLRLMMEHLQAAGARLGVVTRPAEPGEFSARAFFNGKIDLTEAEGIAATINASNEMQLRAAASLREGALHKEMDRLSNTLADLLALVEAGIDFSDEEGVSFVSSEKVASTLEQMGEHIDDLLFTSVRVDRLDALPTVVLIGKPNVGKSSLINVLTGGDRSMVSDVAGTTRDMLSAILHTPAGDIRLMDVPGEEIRSDELRTAMMDSRRRALLEADMVIRVIDAADDPFKSHDDRTDIFAELFVVQNKSDLMTTRGAREGKWHPDSGENWGQVSAKTGEHISELRALIARRVGRKETLSCGRIALNQRHRIILQDVKTAVRRAGRCFVQDRDAFRLRPELVAADLRQALDQLGQITGAISPDEIIGRIFSRFCIGK